MDQMLHFVQHGWFPVWWPHDLGFSLSLFIEAVFLKPVIKLRLFVLQVR